MTTFRSKALLSFESSHSATGTFTGSTGATCTVVLNNHRLDRYREFLNHCYKLTIFKFSYADILWKFDCGVTKLVLLWCSKAAPTGIFWFNQSSFRVILPPIIPCGGVLPKISKWHISQIMNRIGPFQSIPYGSKPLNWYQSCELVDSLPLNSWSKILPKKNIMPQSNAHQNFSGGPLKHFWGFRCIKPYFATFWAVWQCTAKRNGDC